MRPFCLALPALAAALFFCLPAAASPPPPSDADQAVRVEIYPRPVESWLEAQIALARMDYSCGAIDGVGGYQSSTALKAFQDHEGIRANGQLNSETRESLVLTSAPLTQMTLSAADLASLQPLSPHWIGKSEQTALAYETALEMVAERTHANPKLIRQLNPGVDWSAVTPATQLTVPAVARTTARGTAERLHISLGDHVLEAFDADNVIAHFPVSIGHIAEKRPNGELHVTAIIPDPDYTFDPANFPESAEARAIDHKLVLPPGPNNPVGVAWIGLDRPGYGIHGTPIPEQVGRTESHGCFRLTNWDARILVELAWEGLPVDVDP